MTEVTRAKTCEEMIVNELYDLREEVAKLRARCESADETIRWLSNKYSAMQNSVNADKLIDLNLYNAFLQLCADKIFIKEKGGIAVNEAYFAEFEEDYNVIDAILQLTNKGVD